jgi:predicted nuclease of predicted toxin-antitoxin system
MLKFLCDVHISFKIKRALEGWGFVAIHANELPNSDRSTDKEIAQYCFDNGCILISKDFDFVDSYLLGKIPPKFLKVNLGNISKDELIYKIKALIPTLILYNNNNKLHFLIEIGEQKYFADESF